MLGFSRRHLLVTLVALICVFGIVSLALSHFFPAPPSKITMATAFKGASFDFYGRLYKEKFALANVNLDLRETKGAIENLQLLKDPNSGVQIAFMTGGVSAVNIHRGSCRSEPSIILSFGYFIIRQNHFSHSLRANASQWGQ